MNDENKIDLSIEMYEDLKETDLLVKTGAETPQKQENATL